MRTGTLRGHIHHVSVHFVVAEYVMSFIFAGLYLATGKSGLDAASYYTLLAALLFTPAGFISGVLLWRRKFKGSWTKIFRTKFLGGLLLALIGLVSLNMRYLNAGILTGPDASADSYVALLGIGAVCVMILGYYGGRLTIR